MCRLFACFFFFFFPAEDGILDFCLSRVFFFFQAEDGIRDRSPSRGLGDVYKRQVKVEQVYSMEDIETLPNWYAMLNTIAPYITGLRASFIENGNKYRGNADVAVNAGYFNTADLSEAKHSVNYAWSSDRDAFRRFPDPDRLNRIAGGKLKEDANIYPVSYTHLTLPTKRIV